MTRTYVIQKRTRWSATPRGYEGPACGPAGVRPGRVYRDRQVAEEDARRLSEHNPVGFQVVEVITDLDAARAARDSHVCDHGGAGHCCVALYRAYVKALYHATAPDDGDEVRS